MEEARLGNCFACQTQQADAPHDCKTPATLDNWMDAENRLVGQRFVEGLLLLKNQTNPTDVLQVEVAAYVKQHRQELHGKTEWVQVEPEKVPDVAKQAAAVSEGTTDAATNSRE